MTQTPETQLKTAEARLAEALALREAGDLVGAVGRLRELLEEAGFVRGWMELGRTLRRLGEREGALEAFGEAERLDSTYLPSKIDCAVELRKLGQLDRAKEKLNEILKIEPGQPIALFELGEVYRCKNDLDKAIAQYEKTLESEPEHFWAFLQVALYKKELDRLETVEERLKNVLKEEPKHFLSHVQLGLLARHQDQHLKALHWFQKAAQLAKFPEESLHAQLSIIEELQVLERLSEALVLAKEISQTYPEEVYAKILLGNTYHRQKFFDFAIGVYQEILADKPDHFDAQIGLSRSLFELGQAEAALDILTQIENEQKNTLSVQLWQVEILHSLSYLDQVEDKLTQLLERFPTESRILMRFGHLERQRGSRGKALRWFRKAEEHAGDIEQVWSAQLFAVEELRDLKHLDEAMAEIKQRLELRPQNAWGHLILASIYYEKLDLKKAADIYRRLLQYHPNHLEAQLELAQILSETQQVSEAIENLERLFQSGRQDFRILMSLGQLAQSQKDWAIAQEWYELACQAYPQKPQGYIELSEIFYQQGKLQDAITILEEAEQKIPHAPEVPIKKADLQLYLGYPEENLLILKKAYEKFPYHGPIILRICRSYLQLGRFEDVVMLLDSIKFDDGRWQKEIAQLLGELAMRQFQFERAAWHYREAIACAPSLSYEHNQLAQALLLQVKPVEAHEQLSLATDELKRKKIPGQTSIPLKDHVAVLVNQMRMNPTLLEKVKQAEHQQGQDQLLSLAAIIVREPSYLGASLCLAKCLRQQNSFNELKQALGQIQMNVPTIPKRIVQFWDSPTLPPEVEQVARSWLEVNPSYEYVRFSLKNAIAFLRKHYEPDVLKAFQYCGHPATQADLFRLAYLYRMGGFYADADDRCQKSLDDLVASNAELVVYQEEYASIGNNFLGAVPNQPMIRIALYQAVANLLSYTTEGPWFQTGPGLMTCSFCTGLLPYLSHLDYRMWPRVMVLSQEELREYVWPHVALPYKHTEKSWSYAAYHRRQERKTVPSRGAMSE